MFFLRYLDVCLVLATAPFVLIAGLPLLGYLVAAAAWIVTLPTAGLFGAAAYAIASAFGSGALGPVLAESYLAVRRSEWAAYSAGDGTFEQQGHFEKY